MAQLKSYCTYPSNTISIVARRLQSSCGGSPGIDPRPDQATFLGDHDDVIKWKHCSVTGPLCGEFTGHQWIPLTKASDAELWCFLWSAPEQTVEQTIATPVIWCAIASLLLWRHCNDSLRSVYRATTVPAMAETWVLGLLIFTWFSYCMHLRGRCSKCSVHEKFFSDHQTISWICLLIWSKPSDILKKIRYQTFQFNYSRKSFETRCLMIIRHCAKSSAMPDRPMGFCEHWNDAVLRV